MLAVIAAALWLKSDALESKVQAQMRAVAPREDTGVPDSGKQRLLLIDQLDTLNRRVADLERGLREGAFVIQTIEAKAGQKPRAPDEAKGTEK
jgi:hypothetical protein